MDIVCGYLTETFRVSISDFNPHIRVPNHGDSDGAIPLAPGEAMGPTMEIPRGFRLQATT